MFVFSGKDGGLTLAILVVVINDGSQLLEILTIVMSNLQPHFLLKSTIFEKKAKIMNEGECMEKYRRDRVKV